MTRMPIARSILADKKLGVTSTPMIDPPEVSRGIREAKHFEVQLASAMYWDGSQDDYSMEQDFGPLRLPYPAIWMEWKVPPRVTVCGKVVSLDPTQVGALLRECPTENGYRIEATFLTFSRPNPHPHLTTGLMILETDKAGRYIDGSLRYRYDKKLSELDGRFHESADRQHLNVVCLALNLINCKNVTTEEAGNIPVRRSGAQKRRKEPQITYRTIKLPGQPCGGEATDENIGTMPLHKVRGHFKTFTAEAPLLGKLTGTYWWGWQVRGKKKNGEVISDYLVTA